MQKYDAVIVLVGSDTAVMKHTESRSAVQYLLLRNLKMRKGTDDSCCWVYLQIQRVPANWKRVAARMRARPVLISLPSKQRKPSWKRI
jgi:hypothetical protein